jgi:hypothetical protein
MNKWQHKRKELDSVAREHGHTVVEMIALNLRES